MFRPETNAFDQTPVLWLATAFFSTIALIIGGLTIYGAYSSDSGSSAINAVEEFFGSQDPQPQILDGKEITPAAEDEDITKTQAIDFKYQLTNGSDHEVVIVGYTDLGKRKYGIDNDKAPELTRLEFPDRVTDTSGKQYRIVDINIGAVKMAQGINLLKWPNDLTRITSLGCRSAATACALNFSGTIAKFPDGVTSLPDFFLYNNTSRVSIAEWNNIETIGEQAFAKVNFTDFAKTWGKVSTISRAAFWHAQLTLPAAWGSVTEIGEFAFAQSILESKDLPQSWGHVQVIGKRAFFQTAIITAPEFANSELKAIGVESFGQTCLLPQSRYSGDYPTAKGGASRHFSDYRDAWNIPPFEGTEIPDFNLEPTHIYSPIVITEGFVMRHREEIISHLSRPSLQELINGIYAICIAQQKELIANTSPW